MKRPGTVICTIIAAFLLVTACSSENGVSIPDGKGKVNVYLTDAPFPIDLMAKTIVTIDRVEIKKQETDTTGSEYIVLTESEMEVDLLKLTNGVTEMLASVELDAGVYSEIRMHVTTSKVILKDSTEFELKVPSGASSGLKVKIEPAIKINSGETADVLLDFDVSKSFVVKGAWKKGKINGFNFKPVVRCVMLGKAGRIEGTVSDTAMIALENAHIKVWLPQEDLENDSLITSSFSDENGKYKIIGLLEESYYLTSELEGYVTDTIWNVDVTAGQASTVDFGLLPE